MSVKDQILYYYAPLVVIVITLLSHLHLGFSEFLSVVLMFATGYLYMSIMNRITCWVKRLKDSKFTATLLLVVVVMVCTGGFVYLNQLIN